MLLSAQLSHSWTPLLLGNRGFTAQSGAGGDRHDETLTKCHSTLCSPTTLFSGSTEAEGALVLSVRSVVGVALPLLERKGHSRNQLNPARPVFLIDFWFVVSGDILLPLRRLSKVKRHEGKPALINIGFTLIRSLYTSLLDLGCRC